MRDGPLSNVVERLRQAALAGTESDALLVQEFSACRSETAFRILVRRHGPMVFGVCRRWLGHAQDAEDAFQAVFLILARKAAAIEPPEAVGRWLYGVAVRTAQRAKAQRKRRQRHEELAQRSEVSHEGAEPCDWLPLLDEELQRLPDKHRLPIVLCDLLGRSRQEAAAELGIAEGTLSSRLARGREQLRKRLLRRGIVPAVAGGFSTFELNAAVASSLSELTVQACCGVGAASTTSTATLLAEGVIRAMFLSKLPLVVAAGLLVVAMGGVGLHYGSRLVAEPNPPAEKPALVAAKAEANQKVEPEAKKEDRVTALRKERVEELKKVVDELNGRVEAGKDHPITVIDAYMKLMEAELELSSTPQQRIALYEDALKRFKLVEELLQAEYEAGKRLGADFRRFKAARLEVEILLEQAKAKQAKAK